MGLGSAYLRRVSAILSEGEPRVLTVSRIPEALGFPSSRTGSPFIYRDNRLSSGFRVGFIFSAATVGLLRHHTENGLDRIPCEKATASLSNFLQLKWFGIMFSSLAFLCGRIRFHFVDRCSTSAKGVFLGVDETKRYGFITI